MRKLHERSYGTLSIVLAMFVIGMSSCGQKTVDEPTKYRSQAGLEALTQQAQKATQGSSAQNPQFLTAKETKNFPGRTKDIDGVIRPVLLKLFGGARLISATGEEPPKKDGEVVEDRLVYVVKGLLTREKGDALHAALHSSGFGYSPRLGSKPTHARSKVLFSLFESTSSRSYSFVFIVDCEKQKIEVESYRLGSKYDRLM